MFSEGYFHGFFDTRMIYLTGLFDLIGGGQAVQRTLLYTYLAESVEANVL
jgi:hypothetical protein